MTRTLASMLIAITLCTPMNALAGRLKGRLNTETPTNYKVVVVNKNGSSKVATVAENGAFSIVVKRGSSLHLVTTAGRYAGPIVSTRRARAYATTSGVKGSLGAIAVESGFATVRYSKTMDLFRSRPAVTFHTETGPLGAGKFGLALNPVADSTKGDVNILAESDNIGDDLDRDGLPDLLDIDDDGDLKLDIVDEVSHAPSDFNAEITSTLRLEMDDSLNINVGNATDEQVDALIQDNLFLLMLLQTNSDETVSSVNVDCGTLSYCSSTGTATIQMDDPPITNGSLWSSYDPDNDGQPNLYVRENRMPEINLRPQATREQIGTGDTIFFRITTSSGERVLPAVLPFVFVTVPALKEYSSGSSSGSISYPVAEGGPGTQGSPLALDTQSVTLTFWKPQRRAIEGAEDPGYIDMGGLRYGVYLTAQGESNVVTCDASDYTNFSDSLEALSSVNGAQAVVDQADDAPVDVNNTITFTLDIGACLTRNSIDPNGKSVMMDLVATSESQDQASQTIFFQLP